ncbi:MAG: GNAT family N-acetyltransferase [Phycicoccus sp.]
MDGVEVRDDPAENRYEAWVDGKVAGFAAYILAGRLIVFSHTEVDPSFEGRGIGSALARGALDDVRRRGGLQVMPLCPFVKGWMQRHPDYVDLAYTPPPSRVTD